MEPSLEDLFGVFAIWFEQLYAYNERILEENDLMRKTLNLDI